ncbi:hypothetical protein HPB47_005612 [Ixodes persulcatus]|uniref:Uncharacterized protein n=1 Tax=Ixodes persulcatus TaxID=34615 RepID=A0AC60PDR7_IXOPE|nr:hypothetical protein HPB47_005612 [Ixodes persulcatus]
MTQRSADITERGVSVRLEFVFSVHGYCTETRWSFIIAALALRALDSVAGGDEFTVSEQCATARPCFTAALCASAAESFAVAGLPPSQPGDGGQNLCWFCAQRCHARETLHAQCFLAARWVTLLSPAEVDVHLRLPTSTANTEHRILDMNVGVAATLGSITATVRSKTSALHPRR